MAKKKPRKTTEFFINKLYRNANFRSEIFLSIPIKKRVSVFLRLTRHVKYEISKNLPEEDLVNLLISLDPDEAADVLQFFDKDTQGKLVNLLSEDIKRELTTLLKFDENTAGGLMALNYVVVDASQKISEATKKFKEHERRTGKAPEIIVLKDGKVSGYLPGYELGFGKPGDFIGKYMKSIKTIKHGASYDQVIETFRNHPHNKVVVLDDNGSSLGVLYSDDVLSILKDKEGSSLYDFAGVHDEEEVTDPASTKVRFRYKWLILNLATAFLASFVVSLFDDTISRNVLLAVYMPIVAGMGGNAGTQTLAIMVRGIALNQIDSRNFWNPLIEEISAGFVNGVINGLLVFSIVLLVNHDFKVAIVLGIAMVVNLVVAATFGTIVPLIMKALGKDPASSATIFITTATDVLGFLAFLGLATLVL